MFSAPEFSKLMLDQIKALIDIKFEELIKKLIPFKATSMRTTMPWILLQTFAFCVVDINSKVVFENLEDLKHLLNQKLFRTFSRRNWLSLASWALFTLKLYKTFQIALRK